MVAILRVHESMVSTSKVENDPCPDVIFGRFHEHVASLREQPAKVGACIERIQGGREEEQQANPRFDN